MRDVIDQLERSLDQPVYFVSLMAALSIPDIGGALDSDDGAASGERYKAWYERWGRPQFAKMFRDNLPPEIRDDVRVENPLTGDACYRFRCSLLHQGTTQHPKSPYSRIIFIEPGAIAGTFHYNVLNDALNIDVGLFCREMVVGAREWLAAVEGADRFKANYDKFARRYPNGLAPYIVGAPVIG
jgi:hypothetical protein